MNITPDEARVALNDIEQGTTKAKPIYNNWAYHLLIWGLVWTIGFFATQLRPDYAGWIWGVAIVLGMASSATLGIVQGRRTRLVPGSQSAFMNSRLVIFFGVLYGFAVLFLIVFRLTSLQIGLFWIMIVEFGSIIAGVWLKSAVNIWFGAAITIMALLGYFLLPHYFWAWSAVFAGLPLVVLGIYYLLRKS